VSARVPASRLPEPTATLYLIVCGAGPASDISTLIDLAQAQGWRVCVITTPNGAEFVDTARLEELTGYPVRAEFRKPDDPEPSWPPADAIVVAPATINTVSKWAGGIADNLALSMLFECMGVDLPIVVAPNVNPALDDRFRLDGGFRRSYRRQAALVSFSSVWRSTAKISRAT
jgi:Flavoprotein